MIVSFLSVEALQHSSKGFSYQQFHEILHNYSLVQQLRQSRFLYSL